MEPRSYGVQAVASQRARCAGGADSALESGQLTVVVFEWIQIDKPCEHSSLAWACTVLPMPALGGYDGEAAAP